jgi:hypothetical protein
MPKPLKPTPAVGLPSSAVGLALEVLRMPALANSLRRLPLPPDVLVLIRIAGGCAATRETAVRDTGEAPEHIRNAAVFYLQQVVLHPLADSYRVLGATPGTATFTLREHRNWLLKWLHPDLDRANWESVLARRVNQAWQEIEKSKYGPRKSLESVVPFSPKRSRKTSKFRPIALPWIQQPNDMPARNFRPNKWGATALLALILIFVLSMAYAGIGPIGPTCIPLLETCTETTHH